MIKFLVTGQQLNLVTPVVVADTINYQTAEAVFKGAAWDDMTKYAHFNKDDAVYDIPFHDDQIEASQGMNLTAGTWRVWLTGSKYDESVGNLTTRITTTTALLKIEGTESENPFPPITPELSEVLAAEIDNALNIAKGVREDAEDGAFDGATFTPAVDGSGNLSWTNDKGLDNPLPVNIKGENGAPGKGLTILGYYDSFDALTAAVPEPAVGDAYGIGTEWPYDIHIYDDVNQEWVNNGPSSGTPGESGRDATIEIGAVQSVGSDQSAEVINTGTPSAAILNFRIPKGKTPVYGVDYLTDEEWAEVLTDITPGKIGAIAAPEDPGTGYYLKYDGTKWIASPVSAGVSSVNGQTGAVVTMLGFTNQSIAANAWTLQSPPTVPGFPYVASKALDGAGVSKMPVIVFDGSTAAEGNFAAVADSYTGGVYIYARKPPDEALVIPTILFLAAGGPRGFTNSSGPVVRDFEATIGTDWTGDSAPYTQEISIEGLLESDRPFMGLLRSADWLTGEQEQINYNLLARIVAEEGKLKVYALDKTRVDMNVQLEVIRR